MIFSSSTEYAIRGLAELACRGGSDGKTVMLDQLVSGTDIPRDFLAKIFQKLVRAGILTSTKGRGGGFALARPDHEVTLMQIVEAVEGPGAFDGCVVGMAVCNDLMPCAQHDLYKPIRQRLKAYVQTTTLADLAASLKSKLAWHRLQDATALAAAARAPESDRAESK